MPLKLRPFLKGLLDILKEDYPAQLRRMAREARGLIYLQVLDEEKAVIRAGRGGISIEADARERDLNVTVKVSRDCLFRILDGQLTLDEAMQRDELKVFGEPRMILRCYRLWESVISLSRSSPKFYFHVKKLRS